MAGQAPDFRRYLNIRGASGPSFSSDGRRLSFLTNITGVPQVWAVDVGGGWPDQLTFFPDRVSAAEFAPTGDHLVFAMDSGGDEHHQLYLVSSDGAEVRPLTAAPGSIHVFGGWTRDGRHFAFSANRREIAHFDVYAQAPLDSDPASTARLVYQGEGVNNPVAWSPNGSALVVEHVTSLLDDDLYFVGLDGGEVLHLTPHEGQARYVGAAFAADGQGLYLLTDRDRDTLAPAYLDLASRELRLLEESAWDVELLALSPDGRLLATSTNVDGDSELAIRDLATGQVRRPDTPEGVILDLKWSPGGDALAFSLSGPTRNCDVWLLDVKRGWTLGDRDESSSVSQVTRSARGGLRESGFVAPSLVRYPTFDGRKIPALYYRPTVEPLGSPHPVIVSVHGGPEGQEVPAFNPIYQYFLARGYGIFAPNVRGSTGYGKAYTHLDDVRLRMDSVRDLEAGWRWLRENGADSRRIGIMGGSYGGFMVLAAATTYPDLWAAAVDIVGIANFVTFLENTGPWRRKLREAEYGSLEADGDFLREISPIHKIDCIRAPLMVIHGANDPRVPVGEAEQIVEGIRRRGGVVEYLRFEDEGHGLVRLANRIAAYSRIGLFLDQHLAGDTS